MMKTALSIIQGFCYRSGSITAPSTIESITDPQTLKLLHCLYAVCEELRQARCWIQQKRTFSFATEAARARYPLPADFYSPVLLTYFNRSTKGRLHGPVSDDDMNSILYGMGSDGTEYTFRIVGPDVDRTTAGQIQVTPTPADVQTLSFDYLTRNLFLPAAWDSTSTTVYEAATDDTDLCLFDYDLVQLGLEAEYLKQSGADNSIPYGEFIARIDKAVGRYMGAFVGSFEGKDSGPRYKLSTSGSWSY